MGAPQPFELVHNQGEENPLKCHVHLPGPLS